MVSFLIVLSWKTSISCFSDGISKVLNHWVVFDFTAVTRGQWISSASIRTLFQSEYLGNESRLRRNDVIAKYLFPFLRNRFLVASVNIHRTTNSEISDIPWRLEMEYIGISPYVNGTWWKFREKILSFLSQTYYRNAKIKDQWVIQLHAFITNQNIGTSSICKKYDFTFYSHVHMLF